MKLFFEEYGIATMLAIASLSLVTMTTPVGAAISDGLNTAIEQTGPESDQVKELNNKADKSVRALVGEDVVYEPEVVGFYIPVAYLDKQHKSANFTTIFRCGKRDDVTTLGIMYADTSKAKAVNKDTMKLDYEDNDAYITHLEQDVSGGTTFNPTFTKLHVANNNFDKDDSHIVGYTVVQDKFDYNNLSKQYSVRAYCKTTDGKTYYSNNIYTTSLAEIANDMYYNKLSIWEREHEFMYRNILMPISARTNMVKIAQYMLTQIKNDGIPTAKGSDAYNYVNNLYKDLGRFAICSQGYVWDNDSEDKTFTHQDANYFSSITLGRESDTSSDAYHLLTMLNGLSGNKRNDYSTLYEWIINEVPDGDGLARRVEW